MLDENKIIKCGFNTYFDLEGGNLYEKKAGELVPLKTGLCDELERAFVTEKLAMDPSTDKKVK